MIIRLLPFVLVAGCAQTAADIASPDAEERCAAERAQALVGRVATQELAGQALQLSGAKTLRWLQPGMAVTMEYRAGRLNITLDDKNRVTGVTCG